MKTLRINETKFKFEGLKKQINEMGRSRTENEQKRRKNRTGPSLVLQKLP